MREIIQLIVSFTGSLGFAALFNIHGKKLWFAALGGCLSWAVYLAVEFVTPSPYVCGFWSTVAITLYAECMARVHKTPVTVFWFCYDSVDSGGGIVSYYELDDDEELGEFSEGRDLYDPFAASMAAGMTLTTIAFRMVWRWMVQAETDVSV